MLDSYFKITERGSTVGREIRGGVVTFFTMAYIVALNPLIIGLAKDGDGKYLGGGDAPNLAAVAAMTALMAGVLTILMGVVGNYPMALATGLGLNTFVAVGIASKMSWADAMGLVVIEGIIITILVLTGFRTAVFKAVPAQLKIAISVGIGLFIALIGLVDAGFVRRTGAGPVPVTLGDNGTLVGWPIVVFAFGLLLMIALMVKKVKGALLIGIAVATVFAILVESAFKIGPLFDGATGKVNPKGWNLNVPTVPSDVIGTPDFSLFGQFNLLGSFDRIPIVAVILLIFTLLLSDFFDTVGTVTAIGHEGGLIDKDGNIPNNDRILLVDSLAAVGGGVLQGVEQRKRPPTRVGVVAVQADATKGIPAFPQAFAEHPFQLAVTLKLPEGPLLRRQWPLHQIAAAVAQRPRQPHVVAEWVGVAERCDHRTELGCVVHVAFAVDQQGVAVGEQVVLQQGAYGAPLAVASVAVIADGQLTAQRLGFLVNPQGERGLA